MAWRLLACVCAMLSSDARQIGRATHTHARDVARGTAGFLEGNRRPPRSRHPHGAALGARRGVAGASARPRQARQHLRAKGRAGRLVGESAADARQPCSQRGGRQRGHAPARTRDARVGHDELAGAFIRCPSAGVCLRRWPGRHGAANLDSADWRRGHPSDEWRAGVLQPLVRTRRYAHRLHGCRCRGPARLRGARTWRRVTAPEAILEQRVLFTRWSMARLCTARRIGRPDRCARWPRLSHDWIRTRGRHVSHVGARRPISDGPGSTEPWTRT